MSIYRHAFIYRQNYRHDGCPKDLPSYRHGLICKAVEVTVRGTWERITNETPSLERNPTERG